MQALILAAGMGKRLKSLTADNTKCMVEVNGVALVERTLTQLDELNLSRIVLVIGYKGRKVIDFVKNLEVNTPIEFIENPVYDKTNNIYSLALAKDILLEDDTLLLESDLIFERDVLRALVEDPRPTLALVDRYESWMDGTVVKVDDDDDVIAFVPGNKLVFDDVAQYYKTVNVYKFSRDFSRTRYVPFLEAYTQALGTNEYYEQVLRVITMLDDSEMKAKRLNGQIWYEIDDLQDLDIAESMFARSDGEKLALLQDRHGGYWRYPKLIDFCYFINPYYPPRRMVSEMKESFEKLLTQYPSGMRVNTLLAAKNYGIRQERILVGNGATELIKVLMGALTGAVGFVHPAFEEYPNRHNPIKPVMYVPDNDDFSYTVDDVMEYFEGRGLEALVIVNPGNPSGSYLRRCDVERLAQWCEDRGIRLVYDESFIDFSDEQDPSLLNDGALGRYPSLVVIKSISSSHGVPGVRLGVLASSDRALIELLKGNLPAWNINSLGEFYLQIAEKYKNDYARALERLRAGRTRLVEALSENPHLRVVPSQANYVLIEVLGDVGATELTRRLLCESSVFVKDLSEEIKFGSRQYIRIVVRSDADNDAFVKAVAALLG